MLFSLKEGKSTAVARTREHVGQDDDDDDSNAAAAAATAAAAASAAAEAEADAETEAVDEVDAEAEAETGHAAAAGAEGDAGASLMDWTSLRFDGSTAAPLQEYESPDAMMAAADLDGVAEEAVEYQVRFYPDVVFTIQRDLIIF